MTPEPMPPDMKITAKLEDSLPSVCTPMPAAVASFSMATGRPVASASVAASGNPCHAGVGCGVSRTPASRSCEP
jgi:hypothetical protein